MNFLFMNRTLFEEGDLLEQFTCLLPHGELEFYLPICHF